MSNPRTAKTERPAKLRKKYYNQIDGIRAIAVIAVFGNHLNPEIVPLGHLGVDVFFVISGFVITLTLGQSISEGATLRGCLQSFYTKRIKRIMPALLTFTLINGLVISLFDPWNLFSLRTGISGVFGVSNLYLLRYSLDYFKPTGEINPFLNTWSLGVEEQYYLLYPFLIYGAGAFAQKANRDWGKRLGTILLILGLLSLSMNATLSNTYTGTWAHYLMPSRFWEIAMGCLSALIAVRHAECSPNKTKKEIGFSVTAALLTATFFIDPNQFTGAGQVIPQILACALTTILILLARADASPKWCTTKLLTQIGLLSYSIYLWHWSTIVAFRFTLGVTKSTILPIICITLATSALSYYLIEKPARYRLLNSKPRLALGAIGASTALTTGILLSIEQPPAAGISNPLYTGKLYSNFDHISEDPATYVGDVSKRSASLCTTSGKSIKQLADLVRNCTFDRSSKESVLFIGDSHAMVLLPLAEKISKKYKLSTTVITGECSFPAGQSTCPKEAREREMTAFREFLRFTSSNKAKAIVISTSFFPLRFMETSARVPGHSLDGSEQLTKEGIQEFKRSLRALLEQDGDRLLGFNILIHPPVFHSFTNPTLCSPQWFRSALGHTCSKQSTAQLTKERSYITKSLELIGKSMSSVTIIDPYSTICPDGVERECSPARGNTLLYHDFNHLNITGALLLEELLLRETGIKKLTNFNSY